MLGIQDFWLFIAAGLALNATPGPDTAYIVARSAQLGFRGGAAAAFGIACGCLVHIVAATVGLSALLAASADAFTALKLIGAAYLCYIGLRMFFARVAPGHCAAIASPANLRDVFWQGALTNALNPKVALFFLAFLPQFVAAAAPSKALAFFALGMVFNVNGTLSNLLVAAFAARAVRRVRNSPRATAWLNRVLGSVFVYLGVRLATFDNR
jgi:threonine/homoserine/homoserine lactone efflux protein